MNRMEKVELTLAGKPLIIETGELAKQAGGAMVVRHGDSVVLCTACVSDEDRDTDFLPFTVDVEERMYAAGKLPGGFIKREGRPSEAATLMARLIDRPLRPLFPKKFRRDMQVVISPLAVDNDTSLSALGIIGASAALLASQAPINTAVAALSIGYIEGEYIAFPDAAQQEASELHMIVAGHRDGLLTIEIEAEQLPEPIVLGAIKFAWEQLPPLLDAIETIAAKVARPKIVFTEPEKDETLKALIAQKYTEDLKAALFIKTKETRSAALSALDKRIKAELGEEYAERGSEVSEAIDDIIKFELRKSIMEHGLRADGRGIEEVRDIMCKVGFLPRVHGVGLFQRGETQVLTVATLATIGSAQVVDTMLEAPDKTYMHHYNFPPFSAGETGRMMGPRRREIGHGSLAEKALMPVLPSKEAFPYTVRLVSEVLESNGSTSMGAVCGSTLALMDAGVPITDIVAGVAMGLVTDEDRYVLLTDIMALEDFLGDMDCKIAGTEKGVTAMHLDMKIKGLPEQLLAEVFERARKGRLHIIGKMREVISEPRADLSPFAPRIFSLHIDREKIGLVIGPGGKTIKKIIEETNTTIDIEDDGTVYVAALNKEDADKAIAIIDAMTHDPEPGLVTMGKVVRIEPYGAFVEIAPGKDGLLHVSHISWERVEKVEDRLHIGDEVEVKIIEVDDLGRVRLSMKELTPKPEGYVERPERERSDRGGDRRGGDRRGGGRSGGSRNR